MRKIVLDCDPGVDDSVAMIMAAKSPELDLLAVTTVCGNGPVDMTYMNARKVLELVGRRDIPAARGLSKPLFRDAAENRMFHGRDGQAEAYLPEPYPVPDPPDAVDLIISLARQYPHDLTILCTGPMSNLALAFMKAPDIIPLIDEVIALSGLYGYNGSAIRNATGISPISEWNVCFDPEAADVVYRSGVKLTAIGLDAAMDFDSDFTEEDFVRFRDSERKEARFLANAISFVNSRGYAARCAVIDCMVVAYAIDSAVADTVIGHVGVETRGDITLGMTIMDRRSHAVWEHLPVVTVGYRANSKLFLDMIRRLILL